jgi:alanine-glyoxylate transaminase/serine-glyoxylate transaminase/serine-pyruvate transaminase
MADEELLLMIPGPIQPEEDVLEAMGMPVRAHYGPGFTKLYNDTVGALKKVFGTQGDVFVMVSSGSGGLDACLGSTFSSGEKILLGINGFFGERLKNIAESFNLQVIVVPGEWGKPFEPDLFDRMLRLHPDASGVAVVHLETSTTIINPIADIGKIARAQGKIFLVDAVSSLGGLPMQMDEWGIDLCASSSQKCLGAPPGLSPVAVSSRAWDYIKRNPKKGHGWYLNLLTWRQYAHDWADWHPFPITMATSNLVSLKVSLDSLLREGIPQRMERYAQLAILLRGGLRRIGFELYTPDELMCPVLTASYGIKGVPTSRIVSYLADVHQIKIAGGLGELKDKIFRIGHMSPTVTQKEIDQVVNALGQFSG